MNALPVMVRTLLASLLFAGTGLTAAADQPPGTPPAPSKAQREQMAVLHEKMAACLRSDKELAACRDEMRSSCRATMGEQACPMMGWGMRDQMMKNAPAPKPDGK